MSNSTPIQYGVDNAFALAAQPGQPDTDPCAFEEAYRKCLVDTTRLPASIIGPVLERLTLDLCEFHYNHECWPKVLDTLHISSSFRIHNDLLQKDETWQEYTTRVKALRDPGFRCKGIDAACEVSERGKRKTGVAVVWVTLVSSRFVPIMQSAQPTEVDLVPASESVARFVWRRRTKGSGWKITSVHHIPGPGRMFDF